jgi:hypothetical protein
LACHVYPGYSNVDQSAIFDFELSSEEMAEIGALTRPGSQIISRSGLAPDWGMQGATGMNIFLTGARALSAAPSPSG